LWRFAAAVLFRLLGCGALTTAVAHKPSSFLRGKQPWVVSLANQSCKHQCKVHESSSTDLRAGVGGTHLISKTRSSNSICEWNFPPPKPAMANSSWVVSLLLINNCLEAVSCRLSSRESPLAVQHLGPIRQTSRHETGLCEVAVTVSETPHTGASSSGTIAARRLK
jgi:hypothetical protein